MWILSTVVSRRSLLLFLLRLACGGELSWLLVGVLDSLNEASCLKLLLEYVVGMRVIKLFGWPLKVGFGWSGSGGVELQLWPLLAAVTCTFAEAFEFAFEAESVVGEPVDPVEPDGFGLL